MAVVAITASSDTSQTAKHAALAAQNGSFPPVNLDDCPILHTGYPRGGCVAQLQTDLRIVQDPNLDVDGLFGSAHSQTWNAVTAFQTAHGLKPDGMVGPDTKKALEAASPGSAVPPAPAPPTAVPPAPAPPASDHYRVQLAAWIPQASVTGPQPDNKCFGDTTTLATYNGNNDVGFAGGYKATVTYDCSTSRGELPG